jgi:hypothetical protein
MIAVVVFGRRFLGNGRWKRREEVALFFESLEMVCLESPPSQPPEPGAGSGRTWRAWTEDPFQALFRARQPFLSRCSSFFSIISDRLASFSCLNSDQISNKVKYASPSINAVLSISFILGGGCHAWIPECLLSEDNA